MVTLQAGIIEEMLDDTFEGMEDDDLEEAAQEEVDKVLFEVTKGICKTVFILFNKALNTGLYKLKEKYHHEQIADLSVPPRA